MPMKPLPLFPVTMVGSWPRPSSLLRALRRKQRGEFVAPHGKEIGLGVVNPRSPDVETAQSIAARVREVTRGVPAEKIFLNPDCGFGTFSSRPMNTPEIASAKLAA